MLEQLTQRDLKPGDVLLHHSWHWISRLIRNFDGSEFSHASIYDGTMVVEMDTPGIVTKTIDQILSNTAYVHVFRFKNRDGHQLGSRNCPSEPVLDRVRHYLEVKPRLAWGTFPILAPLTLARRVADGRSAFCQALDRVGAPLSNLVATSRNAITCTELVYRCFAEAGEGYDLRILGRGSEARRVVISRAKNRRTISASSQEEDSRVSRRSLSPEDRQYETAWTAPTYAEPAFVTAADLCRTPNLIRIGELSRVRP